MLSVDTCLAERVLQGLHDFDAFLRIAHADLDFEFSNTSFLKQSFGLVDVQTVRLVIDLTEIGARQERLMNRVLAFQESCSASPCSRPDI